MGINDTEMLLLCDNEVDEHSFCETKEYMSVAFLRDLPEDLINAIKEIGWLYDDGNYYCPECIKILGLNN